MSLRDLVAHATDKARFKRIEDYSDFCKATWNSLRLAFKR